jgi:septal ring factor EnvC (AmiA/AmiB activator)
MFDNRRFTWAGFFVALITLCAACTTEGAQEPSKDPLNSIQQKIEVIDNRIDEQDRKMHDTVNELKSKLKAAYSQINNQQLLVKNTIYRETEDDDISIMKRASQTSP